jgi:hypothetical protein
MLRRVCTTTLVLSFLLVQSSYGVGRRARRHACCASHATCAKSKKYAAMECFCLQSLYYDAPPLNQGPDFYVCQYFPDGCGPEGSVEHWSDYWYGIPTNRLVQNCGTSEGDPGTCEHLEWGRYGQASPLGHHQTYETDTDVDPKLERPHVVPTGQGPKSSIMIPQYKMNGFTHHDVYARLTKVTPASPSSPAGDVYFGLETENTLHVPAANVLDNTNCDRAEESAAGGRLIRIKFRIGGDHRVAFVWLRDDRP